MNSVTNYVHTHIIYAIMPMKGDELMILVTSAAGHTGSFIVKGLVSAGFDVIATDISPKVKQLAGIKQAIIGDITRLDFQKELIEQVDQIVYIPPLFSSEEPEIGKSLIDLAANNQMKQFIFISVTHPILSSLIQHTAKRIVEEHLIYTGMLTQLPYTILQPMHYMHNFMPSVVHETGVYQSFYDINSKVAYVDPVDVAEIVVEVARDIKKHDKATYELVGTEPYSPVELVEKYNEVTGEDAVAEYINVDDFLDSIDAQDLFFRAGFKHLAHSYTKWGLDGNSNVLRMLLGREPGNFENYVKRELGL